MLFGETRAAFLEFLRNLTPQILLFSIASILASRLDLNRFSFVWADVMNTLPFLSVLFIFFAAAAANTSLFIEKAATSADWAKAKSIELQKEGVKGGKLAVALLKALCKENKTAFVEILLVLAVAQVGLAVVLIMSIPTATELLQQLNAKS